MLLIDVFLVFDSIPECNRVLSEDPFMIVYCPDRYKTQRMCDEAVDDSLVALKLICA